MKSKSVYKVFCFTWFLCIIFTIIYSRTTITKLLFEESYHAKLILMAIVVVFIGIYSKIRSENITSKKMACNIFIIAFVIRLIFIAFQLYMPTNDFANYF